MGNRRAKGILLAALIWLIIAGLLAVAAKVLILPYLKKELDEETGSESIYQQEVTIPADSFTGYCVLRSPLFKKLLREEGVKVRIVDDNAAYEDRMKSLDRGDAQMAVFTIDSFIQAGAKLGKFPATVVLVIDETKGADAIVAYKESVKSLQDLDHTDASIVLTPDSPSEFLARTVIAHFNLPNLPAGWRQGENGAAQVYRRFTADKGKGRKAYVLWEPYVSMALETPGAHLLLDSSKLRGYIVDVLVAERRFLRDHPDLVRAIVGAYLRAAYAYSQSPAMLYERVREDTNETGSKDLSNSQIERLVNGIEWKNTLENFAYFGLLPAETAKGTQHLEEIFSNISDVLVKTGALPEDPLQGKAHTLFYDGTLRQLQEEGFHPAKKVNIIQGIGAGTDELEPMHAGPSVQALTETQWAELVPVARMRVQPLSFARGTARVHIQSQRELDSLAQKLASWPEYYLLITGHARAQGDPKANLKLAKDRAEAAASRLRQKGVGSNRIKTEAAPASGKTGEAQSVTFELRQQPY